MWTAVKRLTLVVVGVLFQFGFVFAVWYFFDDFVIISAFYRILAILLILSIIKNSTRLSNDLPWIIMIMLLPLFGTFLRVTLGRNYSRNKLLKSILATEQKYQKYLVQDPTIEQTINKNHLDNLRYFTHRAHFPVTANNQITYYEFGEKFYPALLKELKTAEHFIFLEYFIIKKGKMWDGVLEILKEKAASGVDVRVMCDDMGTINKLSERFPKELAKYGIKCIPFNEMTPFRGIFMNNRDHRKMTIIDGRVAFSGGVNLSDEYINEVSLFGVWKDNGIKIVGDAVWNMTVMFLALWNANVQEDKDITKFKYDFGSSIAPEGYAVSYGAAPRHPDLVGEDVYLNLINSAKDCLYIMTPYLVIDTDVVNSLIRAAKRGVDVRIIMPGVPDKKLTNLLSRSFYDTLVRGGVKLYLYTPGFVHSKVFFADGRAGVVGTINLDYRSLYLHFENGIYIEQMRVLKSIKRDFEETFTVCHQLSLKEVTPNLFEQFWQGVLRLFAPLF